MNKVFICTNNKQLLGALVSKFTLEHTTRHPSQFTVEILNVDAIQPFINFHGKRYLRSGQLVRFEPQDLQSFTLARFMPPELLGYRGKAIVIDPDVFAVRDIAPLFELDMGGASIACRRYGSGWGSSVMVLHCATLTHWKINDFFHKLESRALDYQVLMTLGYEQRVMELDTTWNSFDHLDATTKLLHFTQRRTQPWKTGLTTDFIVYNRPKPLFGIIPRVWVQYVLGRQPHTYVRHPDPNQEKFFFTQLAGALAHGYVTHEFLHAELECQHVRRDVFKCLAAAQAELFS